MKPIYLDNNATTRVDPAVLESMLPFFTEQFGNASSTHSFGETVAGAIKTARKQLQELLGAAHDHEIIYTSGGTESNTTAVMAALEAMPGRDEIITSAVEHPSVLQLCEHLEKTGRAKIHVIGVDSYGRLDLDAYRSALSDRVALVSIMWANNETGTIVPVDALADLAKAAGALFHTDAVQAIGKLPVALKDTAIDMLSLSGHKLHAPKGIGALYVKRGVRFKPLIRGGHQERGRRAGTENVPAIVGLGKAAELAIQNFPDELGRVKALRDRLEKAILSSVANCAVNGDPHDRLPNTSNIAFDYIEGEAILLHLTRAGVAASTGSACTAGSTEPSHVLRAMHVPEAALHGAIRFSLSRDNSEADVDRVIEALPPIVDKLRALSPFWSDGKSPSGDATPLYA
ncbi:cysteine desulfurase NifS [Methylocella silvestris]|uniref:Cysteine desulfurase n=1 Tax=Methylocella silvestris TaxID=199596 RepID=A0A2J7TLM7_METSI|nr:cysteine desulfurase NifS [Methylocella silvestris]PNG27676.1 cysteine desulfurase NifS [Methylocella silvestris]